MNQKTIAEILKEFTEKFRENMPPTVEERVTALESAVADIMIMTAGGDEK